MKLDELAETRADLEALVPALFRLSARPADDDESQRVALVGWRLPLSVERYDP